MTDRSKKVVLSEAEWRAKLSPESFHVLRQKGTERAGTGRFTSHKDAGIYFCEGCGAELFSSETKFDSGCGWPSFYQASSKSAIDEHVDQTHGMTRTEVTCSACDGHLGHVFTDGYGTPTGLRYCINSASLGFTPENEK